MEDLPARHKEPLRIIGASKRAPPPSLLGRGPAQSFVDKVLAANAAGGSAWPSSEPNKGSSSSGGNSPVVASSAALPPPAPLPVSAPSSSTHAAGGYKKAADSSGSSSSGGGGTSEIVAVGGHRVVRAFPGDSSGGRLSLLAQFADGNTAYIDSKAWPQPHLGLRTAYLMDPEHARAINAELQAMGSIFCVDERKGAVVRMRQF